MGKFFNKTPNNTEIDRKERMRQETRRIRDQARGNWAYILSQLAPELDGFIEKAANGKYPHGPCPVHGGKNKDGFRLFKNFDETGGGICNTCNNGKGFSDGFGLLMWLKNVKFMDAFRMVRELLEPGGTPAKRSVALRPVPVKSPEKLEEENRKLRTALITTWQNSYPLHLPEAESAHLYLERRGLTLDTYPTCLRMHPHMTYFEDGEHVANYPCLIIGVSDKEGRAVTLHRIYITPSGMKAPVKSPKKLMPYPSHRSLSGGAVRLFEPDSEILNIAEGLETSLAIHQATGMAVWPTVSATLMQNIIIPSQYRVVWIWADKDAKGAGEGAAKELQKRLWAENRVARILVPPLPIPAEEKGVDWLDVLLAEGPEAFPRYTGQQSGNAVLARVVESVKAFLR